MHSGFSRVSDSRYLVQGPFTRFDTVLDSVFQSVKTLPIPAQQSTKQRLQSFLYVRAVMQRLSAELTLKDKAGGTPMIQRMEMWDAFLDAFVSFPPMYPLWTRISSAKHTLAYLLIKVPHLKPHIEAIALQQPDRIYSLELFFEVGEALIKMGEHTSTHDWLTLMEERHSTSQKTQDLRDLISVK